MREDICKRPNCRIGGGLFYGCEVCWTCESFAADFSDIESSGCFWHPFTSNVYGKAMRTVIKEPGWWRCGYWSEKKDV